jgi:2-polyprenyl-3-methyl-5-hydroxy-6-metoxy-1,4-benzoquinol methylase
VRGTAEQAQTGEVAAEELEWRDANRALWNEMAALHPASGLYDVAGVVAGRDDLRPWEDAELGPVDGLDLVHLQCHIGTDTVGWARRGARVVGVDFSATAVAAARRLSLACGLDIEWVVSDVDDAADALEHRTFDVVYTGIGALDWLPDLDRWARVVQSLLRPNGVLYLVELHPMWVALVEDGQTICQPAIHTTMTRWADDDRRSYADADTPLEHKVSFERLSSISDVISAVLAAGLVVELFHEFDTTPAPTPWLQLHDDRLYHFPPDGIPFPLTYSLRARRPDQA